MIPILALDLSRARLGWTVDSNDGPPRSGSRELAYAGADEGEIGLAFKNFLLDMMRLTNPQIVAIEAPVLSGVPQNQHGMEIKLGLLMLARVLAKPQGVRIVLGNVTTVRKHFVGHGRPGKDSRDSKRIVFDRCVALGWPVKNHDESDSAALWCWAKAVHDRSFRLETGALLSLADAARRVA